MINEINKEEINDREKILVEDLYLAYDESGDEPIPRIVIFNYDQDKIKFLTTGRIMNHEEANFVCVRVTEECEEDDAIETCKISELYQYRDLCEVEENMCLINTILPLFLDNEEENKSPLKLLIGSIDNKKTILGMGIKLLEKALPGSFKESRLEVSFPYKNF